MADGISGRTGLAKQILGFGGFPQKVPRLERFEGKEGFYLWERGRAERERGRLTLPTRQDAPRGSTVILHKGKTAIRREIETQTLWLPIIRADDDVGRKRNRDVFLLRRASTMGNKMQQPPVELCLFCLQTICFHQKIIAQVSGIG